MEKDKPGGKLGKNLVEDIRNYFDWFTGFDPWARMEVFEKFEPNQIFRYFEVCSMINLRSPEIGALPKEELFEQYYDKFVNFYEEYRDSEDPYFKDKWYYNIIWIPAKYLENALYNNVPLNDLIETLNLYIIDGDKKAYKHIEYLIRLIRRSKK